MKMKASEEDKKYTMCQRDGIQQQRHRGIDDRHKESTTMTETLAEEDDIED